MIPELDFETYSEAGFIWDAAAEKWCGAGSGTDKGIALVGAPAYTEHPSAEVLCAAYDLHDGIGVRLWVPGMWAPDDLFAYVAAGGLIEAHNSIFEYLVWNNICVRRYGWPALPLDRLRCSAARARLWTLPGSLEKAGAVLAIEHKKIEDGKRLLNKFSVPHTPTKKDARLRIHPADEPEDSAALYAYCAGDILAERDVSAAVPEWTPEELEVWKVDQIINTRGIAIDIPALEACVAIVDAAHERYTQELREITGGEVSTSSEVKKLSEWLARQGAPVEDLTAESVEYMLTLPLPAAAHRALEIRSILGSASVKKLYSIRHRLSADGRLRDLFQYAGALHTGRWSGKGPQPQNLPRTVDDVDAALAVISTRSLDAVEAAYGDPVAVVSGCLRGLFCAGPGRDLICSDYKAIEAVVLAELAGEAWRQEVFAGHGMIYEMSAAKITGTPFVDIVKHKKETGEHHPLRKTVGKVAELASGYQGGLGAWKKFGADKFMSDEQIKAAVQAWRRESPAIVKFWYAMEDCAVAAIQNPGKCFEYRGIGFGVGADVLHIRLLSGRYLYYHAPRTRPDVTPWGREVQKISYMGWNSRPGTPPGWMRLDTYGGAITENICQGTARDILAHALVGLERAGYAPVLHVHDEPCGEVPEGWGSVEEFEQIMTTLPAWCRGWPIKATGGWRGKRYRKD